MKEDQLLSSDANRLRETELNELWLTINGTDCQFQNDMDNYDDAMTRLRGLIALLQSKLDALQVKQNELAVLRGWTSELVGKIPLSTEEFMRLVISGGGKIETHNN